MERKFASRNIFQRNLFETKIIVGIMLDALDISRPNLFSLSFFLFISFDKKERIVDTLIMCESEFSRSKNRGNDSSSQSKVKISDDRTGIPYCATANSNYGECRLHANTPRYILDSATRENTSCHRDSTYH